MTPLAVKIVRGMGFGWCALVIGGYIAMWLFSEHGGGLFSQEGWGEMSLIAIGCLPGVGLIKWATRRALPKPQDQ